jgi:hypothetical protein
MIPVEEIPTVALHMIRMKSGCFLVIVNDTRITKRTVLWAERCEYPTLATGVQ